MAIFISLEPGVQISESSGRRFRVHAVSNESQVEQAPEQVQDQGYRVAEDADVQAAYQNGLRSLPSDKQAEILTKLASMEYQWVLSASSSTQEQLGALLLPSAEEDQQALKELGAGEHPCHAMGWRTLPSSTTPTHACSKLFHAKLHMSCTHSHMLTCILSTMHGSFAVLSCTLTRCSVHP